MEKVIKEVEEVGIDTLKIEIIWKQLRTTEYVYDLTNNNSIYRKKEIQVIQLKHFWAEHKPFHGPQRYIL